MKFGKFRQILEKYSSMEFHANPSSGSRGVLGGRTDWNDGVNRRYSKFFAKAPQNEVTLILYVATTKRYLAVWAEWHCFKANRCNSGMYNAYTLALLVSSYWS